MKKPLTEIKIIGILLLLYPFFRLSECLILAGYGGTIKMFETPGAVWAAASNIIFFAVLGIGVLKRVWQIRLAAIIFTSLGLIGPLLGFIIAPFLNLTMFMKVLKEYGAVVVIWKPLLVVLPGTLYLLFVLYKLTRPVVKAEFELKKRNLK